MALSKGVPLLECDFEKKVLNLLAAEMNVGMLTSNHRVYGS